MTVHQFTNRGGVHAADFPPDPRGADRSGSPFHFRMSGMRYEERDEFGVYPKKEKPRGPIAVMAFAVSMSFIAGFVFRDLAGF